MCNNLDSGLLRTYLLPHTVFWMDGRTDVHANFASILARYAYTKPHEFTTSINLTVAISFFLHVIFLNYLLGTLSYEFSYA